MQDDGFKPSQIHKLLYSNNLNTPIKSSDCQTKFKNQGWTICCLNEIHFKYKDTNSSKFKKKEKYIPCSQ